uniref:Protein kinase domain-containing protein n=1 Tax=Ascaris lumbricoides TaxID=6252 RepID=A0A0M3HR31_ASCLU
MPVGESTQLRERPALRLDSRLVCKYEVLSVIGKGSFSQVLRVQHRITRQFFAVKLVSSDCGAVNNELNILSRLSHPFVIRLEEVVFKSSSRLFIVMEMASGGEMYDRVVAKGRYSEPEARQALRMLLSGLAYLHGIRVTHRDLKPENLLYSDSRPDARLLITDFGLAHQVRSPQEKMTETCGTPEYIAPEVLLRVAYTEKVDMWAVGVIAYILMSGIMPFDDDCRSRLYTHIITANYVYYPQFWSGSELAKQFVDSLLETNPEIRLSATDALKHDWMLGERAHLNVTIKARPASEYNTMQRTKSTRSIRSVTRSDHGHRVDPREVDLLANDLQRLAMSQQSTKHYGVF